MTFTASVYRVLIASPSDVEEERKRIPEVMAEWNAQNSTDTGVVFVPVKWETHSTPQMGDRPQAIINRQLVQSSDILIGVFWTRIGSPTGVAESGSVEEIREFIQSGKRVMLYFSSVPVNPSSIDRDQHQKLEEFKYECFQQGLVDRYSSVEEFCRKLTRYLTSIAKENDGNVIQRDDVSASSEWVVIFKELRRCRHEWNAVRPQGDNMAVAKDGMPFIKAIQRYLAELRTMLD